MESSKLQKIVIFGASFLVGFLLSILPLPSWAAWARPEWVFLILMFWVIEVPEWIGIGTAWIIGLVLDLLSGTVLGQHAFVFTLIAYMVIKFQPQLRNFPMWQQSLTMLVLALFNLVAQYWILGFVGSSPGTWVYWLSAVTSVMIWPWMSMLLRECRNIVVRF